MSLSCFTLGFLYSAEATTTGTVRQLSIQKVQLKDIKYISIMVVDLILYRFKWVQECIDVQVEAAKCEVGLSTLYDKATWYITSCLRTHARTIAMTVKLIYIVYNTYICIYINFFFCILAICGWCTRSKLPCARLYFALLTWHTQMSKL